MNLVNGPSGKLALAVLAGASVGAALGVLFAPDKGTTTRKKISDTSHEYATKLNGFVESITPRFHAVKDEIKEQVMDGVSKVQTKTKARSTQPGYSASK